jgi:phosphate transport system permease protein
MSVTTEQRKVPGGMPSRPRSFLGIANFGDRVFKGMCQSACILILVLVGLLLVVLLVESLPSVEESGLSFLFSKDWDPRNHIFGSLAFVYGTLITSAIAMLIAVPLGVGTAAFLSEISPGWIRRIVTFSVEMLAAIPSVVYGFWGMFVLAPLVQKLFTALGGPNVSGRGILSCSLVLAIMIVPYVTAVSYDVCRSVPSSQRQAALALGATRWQTIWTAVLPYARPGIMAASFIALGRALGETMAATMLIGNKETWLDFKLWALGDTMASKIANNWAEAVSDERYRAALVELGLVLFLVTLVVNVLARWLIWQMGRPQKRRALWQRLFVPEPANGQPLPERGPLPDRRSRARGIDRIMTGVLIGCTACTVGPLVFILSYLLYKGFSSLDWAFFTQLPLDTPGGIANALYGSGLMVGLATLAAIPVGVFAAIYLAEYRNGRLAHAVRFIGELLGGVPSIVIGIFGYSMVVVPLSSMTDHRVTFCAWAGAFALAVMMIPIVMRASEEALKLVPRTLRNASMALGANNWQTILRITVPAALPAIVTAIFLSIARIAGETAPLLLTAGGNDFWPRSPDDRTPSLPAVIYYYSKQPDPEFVRKAWAAALVLMVLVLLLNFGIRWITGKRVVLASRAD